MVSLVILPGHSLHSDVLRVDKGRLHRVPDDAAQAIASHGETRHEANVAGEPLDKGGESITQCMEMKNFKYVALSVQSHLLIVYG